MVAKRGRYLPLQCSERLVLPLTLCRAASVAHAVALMTLGESYIYSNGNLWGEETLRTRLKLGRIRTGEPKRRGYNQSHLEAFLQAFNSPRLRPKDYIYNKSKLRIRSSLQRGYAVTFAGNVGGTPRGSNLRRDVNAVAHEIIFWDWQGGNRSGNVAFIDPMTPQGSGSYIRRVPVSHMWAFAKAFKQNKVYIAERWKIGDYTAARMQEKASAKLVLQLQHRVLALKKTTETLDREYNDLVDKYNALEAQLTAQPDTGVHRDAEQKALTLMRAAIVQLKS